MGSLKSNTQDSQDWTHAYFIFRAGPLALADKADVGKGGVGIAISGAFSEQLE